MKLKAIILVCTLLGSVTHVMPNPTTTELLRSIAHTYAGAQQNLGTVVQATAGALTFAAGSVLTGDALRKMYQPKKRILCLEVAFFSTLATYCGYHTFNDSLKNKPNELIKSIVKTAKEQLSKLQINEQK